MNVALVCCSVALICEVMCKPRFTPMHADIVLFLPGMSLHLGFISRAGKWLLKFVPLYTVLPLEALQTWPWFHVCVIRWHRTLWLRLRSVPDMWALRMITSQTSVSCRIRVGY